MAPKLRPGHSVGGGVILHPVHGYPIRPTEDLRTMKRNARERSRVQCVNKGFETLREHIPTTAGVRKISKVSILNHAVEYIQYLHMLVNNNTPGSQSMSGSGLGSPAYGHHSVGPQRDRKTSCGSLEAARSPVYPGRAPLTALSSPANHHALPSPPGHLTIPRSDCIGQAPDSSLMSDSGYSSCSPGTPSHHYLSCSGPTLPYMFPGAEFQASPLAASWVEGKHHSSSSSSPYACSNWGSGYVPSAVAGVQFPPDSTVGDEEGGEREEDSDDVIDAIEEWAKY